MQIPGEDLQVKTDSHFIGKFVLLDNALFFLFYQYYAGGCWFKFGITFVAGCRYVCMCDAKQLENYDTRLV